jgi:hypothetical protein
VVASQSDQLTTQKGQIESLMKNSGVHAQTQRDMQADSKNKIAVLATN